MARARPGAVVYRWEWKDPTTGALYFYVGFSVDAKARWKTHKQKGVNRHVRAMEDYRACRPFFFLPFQNYADECGPRSARFNWHDVKSYIVHRLSPNAPAALGYPVEAIFNVFFGATDQSDSNVVGLNVNLLDGPSGTLALSRKEFDEIWDRAVDFFSEHKHNKKVSVSSASR